MKAITPSLHPIVFPSKTKYENTKNWYAICTKSRFEKKLNSQLTRNGYETFLPIVKTRRQWSDRIKKVELPLIPSYVFIKIDRRDHHHVYYYPGFVKFLSECNSPAIIKEDEINILKNALNNNIPIENSERAAVGDKVKIILGALVGNIGVVNKIKNKNKVNIYLQDMQQAFTIDLPNNYYRIIE